MISDQIPSTGNDMKDRYEIIKFYYHFYIGTVSTEKSLTDFNIIIITKLHHP